MVVAFQNLTGHLVSFLAMETGTQRTQRHRLLRDAKGLLPAVALLVLVVSLSSQSLLRASWPFQ